MDIINQAALAFIVLIDAGGVFRILKLIVDIIGDPDSTGQNIKRIRNVIIFMVLATLIFGLKDTITTYFGLYNL